MLLTSEEVRDSFHYLYPAELPELKRLVAGLPPQPVIVNIGSGAGTSGLAFVEARPDCVLYTIDVQDESSPFGCLEAERDVFKRAGQDWRLNSQWFQICGDSAAVGRSWSGYDVDMVFIDGDHTFAGCAGDIRAWLPRIVEGGLMVVHDYRKGKLLPDPDGPHPMAWPGVDLAVDMLLTPHYGRVLYVNSLIAFRIAGV
jgi:predicted O-methyltransferase YrrM